MINMQLFDSHCHIHDPALAADTAAVIARARSAGVVRMVDCGTSEKDWPDVQRLCAAHAELLPSFGLHPLFVQDRSEGWYDSLARFLSANPSAGVGEIGLDHAMEDRSDEEQSAAFRSQLELARDMNRPASIHCRRAWSTMLLMLQDLGSLPAGFVIHSYSGSLELIEPLARAGAFFSFSGTLPRSHNKRSHRTAAAVPLDRLLIETDAPDLMPSYSGAEPAAVNEPANLPYILKKLAELRALPEDRLTEQLWENSLRLFLRAGHEGQR